MRASFFAWGLSFVLLTSGTAVAQQSLADAARKAEAERKAVKTPGKVYTNDDLKRYGGAPPAPAPSGEAGQAAPPAAAAPPAQAGQPGQPGPEAAVPNPAEQQQPVKDEAWWRKTLAEVRGKLERSKAAVEALESQIYAMQVDFYSRNDVSEREPIAREIEKAMAEKDKKYREMEEASARLAELDEEARRTHVLPGWLR